MDKLLDLILATQFTTTCAWVCAVLAHLVDNHANENWQFSVYVLLILSLGFMLAPYTMFLNEENSAG